MAYLTEEEFMEFGFNKIDGFEKLLKNAELTIDMVTNYFYRSNDLETDIPLRKEIFKQAIAQQINYLNQSGITNAESKQTATQLNIGRTLISLKNNQNNDYLSTRYNLSLDALNLLKSIGFGYREVLYDR